MRRVRLLRRLFAVRDLKRSPVLWNGLPLQSAMHGVVDLALIPIWPGDRVEVRYGGQSAAQSSGSMGGSVILESQTLRPEAGFLGIGSGSRQLGACGKYAFKRLRRRKCRGGNPGILAAFQQRFPIPQYHTNR